MPSTTQAISNLNLPKAPIMSQNKATVVLTDESMAKFQAQMADLASLIDSYHATPNETSKAACDEMLRTALAGLPAESRENAMQHTPPRVYSYYQESFKGINPAGNDKKEALIQAQIHQDQQVTLTAQQIAQIKLQAAKDYSDFWSKYDHFDWEHSSKEEILRHINETPQMMLNWMQQIDKNAEKLPPELQQAYRLQSLQEGIEQKKQEAEKFQRLEEEARERGDTEAADKYRVAAQNANIQGKAMAATKNKVEKQGGNVKDSYTEKDANGESIEQRVEEDKNNLIINSNDLKAIVKTAKIFGVPDGNIAKMNEMLHKKKLEEWKELAKESFWSSEDIAKLEKISREHSKNEKSTKLSPKEQKVEALKNAAKTVKILKEWSENTSLSEPERIKARNISQSIDTKIKEVVQDKNVDQKIVQMAGIDVSKYQTPDNQEKAQDSNEQSATEQKADKATDNTQESPAAPKVPNENNADNTEKADTSANTAADTHSNTEESDKSAESVSGLTTLKLSGTKIDNDESNYQFRTNGAELA